MSYVNPANTVLSFFLLYSFFILISFSFYAQIIHNWRRKKTFGFSIDYILLGLFSYLYYVIFITCYYFYYFYIQFIRLDSTIVDVLFGIHSFLGFLLLSIQAVFEWEKTYKHISIITKIIISFSLGCVILLNVISSMIQNYFSIEDYGFVISFYVLYCLKYYFQIQQNNSRKSTIGFNVLSSLFDLGGNILAVLYYICNITLLNEWRVIDIIGLVCFSSSVIGNICLIVQHWVLFSNSNSDLGEHFFEHFLINTLE